MNFTIRVNGREVNVELSTEGVLNFLFQLLPSHIDGLESSVFGIIERKRKIEKGDFIPEADGTLEGNGVTINAIRTFLVDRAYIEDEPTA